MSSLAPNQTLLPHAGEEIPDKGIDLIALSVAILVEWRLGVAAFVVVSVLCVGGVFMLKPQFVATATILPQESHSEGATLASLFSTRGPGALYIGLLKSRSVQNVAIDHAHLLQLFHTNSYETARSILTARSSFTEGADSIVVIGVKDTNAQDAAMIANAYLYGLESLNESMALAQSKQTKDFFQAQLDQEKGELAAAEEQLEQTQKQTGIVQSDTQTQIGLNAIASTRQQITALNVQLTGLLQSESEQNPQVQTLRSQIARLEEQERTLEVGGTTPVGAAPSAGEIPERNLDLARAQRQVRYHDTIVNSLATQYESARLSEDLSQSAFQIIDRAVAPEHKDWPPRKPFILISLVFAVICGVSLIVLKLIWLRISGDPVHRASFAMLRGAFSSK
jgi:uncharacterized protein involved in exopolysaccharide biosynthesis